MILEIALPIPVRKSFDYQLPDDAAHRSPDEIIGCRVKVPFGFRPAVGIVIGVKPGADSAVGKLKTVIQFLDDEPVLDEHMLALGRWLSKRTLFSIGEAVFFLLPPSRKSSDKS